MDDIDLSQFRAQYSADVVKTGIASTRTYPAIVAALLEDWISRWRPPHLCGPDHGRLWISKGGRPAVAATLYTAIRKLTTAAPWGYAITPHRLRDAGATLLVEASPDAARLATHLLGHTSERMTANYVETAVRVEASHQGRRLIAQAREMSGQRARGAADGHGTLVLHPRSRAQRPKKDLHGGKPPDI